jgi:hypothetical protein
MPGKPHLATQVEEGNGGLKTLNPKPLLLLGFRVYMEKLEKKTKDKSNFY